MVGKSLKNLLAVIFIVAVVSQPDLILRIQTQLVEPAISGYRTQLKERFGLEISKLSNWVKERLISLLYEQIRQANVTIP